MSEEQRKTIRDSVVSIAVSLQELLNESVVLCEKYEAVSSTHLANIDKLIEAGLIASHLAANFGQATVVIDRIQMKSAALLIETEYLPACNRIGGDLSDSAIAAISVLVAQTKHVAETCYARLMRLNEYVQQFTNHIQSIREN